VSADLDLGVRVGDVVHFHPYVAPGVALAPGDRAAIVTRIVVASTEHAVDLCVLDHNGMRFEQACPYSATVGYGGTWSLRSAPAVGGP